jgi:hypothetical protein
MGDNSQDYHPNAFLHGGETRQFWVQIIPPVGDLRTRIVKMAIVAAGDTMEVVVEGILDTARKGSCPRLAHQQPATEPTLSLSRGKHGQ